MNLIICGFRRIHVKYKGLRLSLFTYNTHIMPMNDHEYQFRHQRLYQVCQIGLQISLFQNYEQLNTPVSLEIQEDDH